MIGTESGSICLKCHKQGDKGYETANEMAQQITDLKQNIAEAQKETDRTAQYGRDVSIAKMKIKDAQDALIKARTLVHTVSLEKLKEVVLPAEKATSEAVETDKEATVDLAFRYVGLSIFLIVALIIALLLYLKVRQMEK